MLATTEAHKVFAPLRDRCMRVDLEDYTSDELAAIIKLNLPHAKFGSGVLRRISSVLRGNARAAQKMANIIGDALEADRTNKFTNKDWNSLVDDLSIYPLGLNESEMKVLRVIGKGGYFKLMEIHSQTELSLQAIRQNLELFLMKHDLMKITTNGRVITKEGKEYLDALNTSK
tara:strand:- start:485 stop:1003 length:519 start_codon:yes stop_codon:yes gene_type:complete